MITSIWDSSLKCTNIFDLVELSGNFFEDSPDILSYRVSHNQEQKLKTVVGYTILNTK